MRAYAYASYADVNAHLSFVGTWTATSRPNATQVHRHLMDASDELDAALSLADYSTPVSPTAASTAFELARAWSAIGAAAHTAYSMPQGSDSKHAATLESRWKALLGDVREGNRVLTDSGQVSTRSDPSYEGTATGRFDELDPYALR